MRYISNLEQDIEQKGWRSFNDAAVFGTEVDEESEIAFSSRYVV